MTEKQTRRAVVRGAYDRGQVEAYLPANYRVVDSTVDGSDARGRMLYTVEGTDSAGWTLDGYVIPRLASGLLWATEVEVEATA
jgi:hypothetical protein